MPASTTWSKGLDGSRVMAQFLTTPHTVWHLPFPTNYKSDLTAGEGVGALTRSTVKDRMQDLLIWSAMAMAMAMASRPMI